MRTYITILIAIQIIGTIQSMREDKKLYEHLASLIILAGEILGIVFIWNI